MTQHVLEEHSAEDKLIMPRLALVISGFVVFTALLAITVGAIMG
jgi:hypothetical protein